MNKSVSEILSASVSSQIDSIEELRENRVCFLLPRGGLYLLEIPEQEE